MTDAIVQWLLSAGEGKFLATVLISMLPVIELRGGLPAGVAMGLPLREAFFAALLGSELVQALHFLDQARTAMDAALVVHAVRLGIAGVVLAYGGAVGAGHRPPFASAKM